LIGAAIGREGSMLMLPGCEWDVLTTVALSHVFMPSLELSLKNCGAFLAMGAVKALPGGGQHDEGSSLFGSGEEAL